MDAALDWLFTLQAAPDDAASRAAFEAWRGADPARAQAFSAVAGAWDLPEMDIAAAALAKATTAPRAGRVRSVVSAAATRRRRLALAAAAVLLLAVGLHQAPGLILRWRADYLTQTGARAAFTLPDGSRMTLNTASAAALDFEAGRRAVTLLAGEAYFDVLPDPQRPFVVVSAFSEVEVKGTAFSVRKGEAQDTVLLARGHVEVARRSAPADRAALDAGEAIDVSATAFSPLRAADAERALAWLDGRIVFADQPFGAVLEEIGRYYPHTILVTDGALERVAISGNYRLDAPERTIRSLATAAGASVTRLPGGVLILR
nr:FecR domain-containing protein [Prosthecomicrobium pneumaticum]